MTRQVVTALILIFTPFLIALLWPWVGRRTWSGGTFQPAAKRRPDRVLRRTEAFAILAVGLAAVLLTGTQNNPAVGVYGLSGSPVLGVLVLLAGFLLVAVLHFVALAGRTRAAAWLIVFVAIAAPFAYGRVNELIDERNGPEPVQPPAHIFRIEPQGFSMVSMDSDFTITPAIRGAELWVNGVCLGPIPVRITEEEFREKVPHWDKPPEGFDLELAQFNADAGDFSGRYEEIQARRTEWFQITLEGNEGTDSHRRKPWDGDPENLYYARLKLGEDWGVGKGYATTEKQSRKPYLTDFSVEFRDYNRRLNHLINQARLLGGNLPAEWFSALESYGDYGEIYFYELVGTDPALVPAVAAWARWRYGFPKEPTPAQAWKSLLAVCGEADHREEYDSRSLQGLAVEVLVPFLDPEHLALETAKRLRRLQSRSLSIYVESRATGHSISASGGGRYGSPPSFAVLLHACRIMDRALGRQDDTAPNIIERRIPRELLRWGEARRDIGHPLWLAFDIGGPDLERYLLRHDWRSEKHEDSASVSEAGRVNRWFYLLVRLDSPAGDQFRRRNLDKVFDLAEGTAKSMSSDDFHLLDLLFFDLERGEDSLAMRFWPRFKSLMAKRDGMSGEDIELPFLYLNRMGALTTNETYLECWKEHVKHNDATEGLRALGELPDDRHRMILESIFEDVREDPEYYRRRLGDRSDPDYYLKMWVEFEFPGLLQKITSEQRGVGSVDWVLNPYRIDRVMDLIRKHPEIDILAAAAHHEESRFRIKAVDLIVDYPSRHGRELLDELIEDPDERVRAAAEKGKRRLAELAETPPSEFAHPLAGGKD